MRPYKVKVEQSVMGKPTELKHTYGVGYCVKVQAVYYSGKVPEYFLHLFDAGGDEFMFGVPGQATPKVTSPEIPVTVRLPLTYIDEQGQNEIIVWGEVYPIEKKEISL